MASCTQDTMASCSSCNKAPPEVQLKRCAKCSTTPYCSRECQRADWKSHKKACGKLADASHPPSLAPPPPSLASPPPSLSPPKGLEQPIASPFTRLDSGTWLHGRPETDVFRLLIDAYRLRVDDYNMEGEADVDSLYGGAPDGLAGFRRFLGRAASRPGLLPPWWDAAKRAACGRLGMTASQWHDLRCTVEKSDVVDHYGDPRFPMQLRMFAEAVYGRGPGGMSGAAMRRAMMAAEQGTMDMDMSVLDASPMLRRR